MSDILEELRQTCPENSSDCCAERDRGAGEIERLTTEVSSLKVVYELVTEQSHLCSDKRCIGFFPEEGKHRCRLCNEMLAAVTAVKEQK